MLRVLHVTDRLSPSDGGPPRACLQMAEALAARGHQVSVFASDMVEPGEPPFPALWHQGTAEIRCFPIGRPRIWRRSPALGQALAEAIPHAHVVHIHSLWLWHCWIAADLCQRHRIPYVISPHGNLFSVVLSHRRWRKVPMNLLFQRRSLVRAAAIHFTAEFERRHAAWSDLEGRGLVIPLGVDPQALVPPPKRRADTAPRLLFLARLHPCKGLDLLAAALIAVAPVWPTLHLTVAGTDAGSLDAFRHVITAAGLESRVEIVGPVEGEAKWALMDQADLFILPSRRENFGLAVVEAMARGLPVLITSGVAIAEDITGTGAGWAPKPEPRAVAEALATALAERALWPARGAAGRRLVETRFSWPVVAPQMESAYATLAGMRP